MLMQTLVLLVSINFAQLPIEWRYRDYNQRLEQMFKESFQDSKYRIKVQFYAKQDDLWKTLRDPNNVGVFWVSHAGYASAFNAYTSSFSTISDEFGYDVSPVFQAVHQNTQFIGIVGCSSKKVIQQENFFSPRDKTNPLKVAAYEKTVEIFAGLKGAISQFKANETSFLQRFRSKDVKSCKSQTAFPVVVTRKIPLDEVNLRHPPVRVETATGKVLGVLPKAFPGEAHSTTIYLDSNFTAADLNLYVNAGNNVNLKNDEISLGEFDFQFNSAGQDKNNWSVIKNQNGKSMGITRNFFKFNSEIPSQGAVNFNSCQ